MRSHPNESRADAKALLDAPFDADGEFYAWREGDAERRAYLLHRLDAPTSGLILCALDADVAQAAREAFAGRDVRKVYYAVVQGRAPRAEKLWRDRMTREGVNRMCIARGGEFEAETLAKCERFSAGRFPCSLLRLEPKTGRKHQLRVQCAKRRMPIVGDATYGDFAFNKRVATATGVKRLCLHAACVSLELKLGGAVVRFRAESAVPEEFGRLLSG